MNLYFIDWRFRTDSVEVLPKYFDAPLISGMVQSDCPVPCTSLAYTAKLGNTRNDQDITSNPTSTGWSTGW